jgi:hypothetical protein
MSIITILLALLLGGTGSANVHLTNVSGSTTTSPAGVIGCGPVTGPASSASVDSVYGGGPVGGPASGASVDGVAGGGPVT